MINQKTNKYNPGISEMYHIIEELKKFKDGDLSSTLKINLDWLLDFNQYQNLDGSGCWSYSYSKNEISLKFINENNIASKVFKNDEKFNLILLDDIQLVTWDMYQGMIEVFDERMVCDVTETEFCEFMIDTLKSRIRILALENTKHSKLIKDNCLSLQQLQKDGGSLSLLENAMISYYTKMFSKWATFSSSPELAQRIPYKVLEFERSDDFEKRLAKSLSDSDGFHIDYGLYLMVKDNLHLSATFLKYYFKFSLQKERINFPISETTETFKQLFFFLKENLSRDDLKPSTQFLFRSMSELKISELFKDEDFYNDFYVLYKIEKE